MSDQPGKRPQSKEIRTTLVDSGWSDVPPSTDEPTTQLSLEDLRKIVQAHTPERAEPRELPRYESSSDDASDSEQVRSDDATKRVAYAALLGGSQAGRGGPRQLPDRFYEQPTLVGHQPLSEDAARKLAGLETKASAPVPSGWTPPAVPATERPLPSFDEDVEPNVDDFERAARRLESSAPHAAGPAEPRARLGSDPLPKLGFDDSDLTQRVELKMPPEMFPGGAPAGDVSGSAHARGSALPEPTAPVVAAAGAQPRPEVPDLAAELEVAFAAATTAVPGNAMPQLASPPEAMEPRRAEHAATPMTSVTFPPTLPEELAVPGVGQALAQRCRFFGMRVPLWLLWAVPLTAALVVVVLALQTDGAFSTAGPDASVDRPPSPPASTARGAASVTLQQRAAQGDPAALRQLAERPEHERSVDDAVAIAKGRSFEEIERLEALRKQLAGDASLIERAETKDKLFAFVHDPRTAPDALRLLSELEGSVGADFLYEIWTGTKKTNDITQLARELVYKQSVQARASEALKVALALRAEPSCQSIPEILPRAEQHGDWRSLHLLGKLLLPRGCGDDQRADCYPCLRNQQTEGQLNEAIKAVRSRPRPKL